MSAILTKGWREVGMFRIAAEALLWLKAAAPGNTPDQLCTSSRDPLSTPVESVLSCFDFWGGGSREHCSLFWTEI